MPLLQSDTGREKDRRYSTTVLWLRLSSRVTFVMTKTSKNCLQVLKVWNHSCKYNMYFTLCGVIIIIVQHIVLFWNAKCYVKLCVYVCIIIIEVSLSKCKWTDPVHRIMVSMSVYLSIYLCIIYPAFSTPWLPWNAPCILVYWCAHVYDLQLHSTEQQKRMELLVVCHEDCWQRQVCECADIWYKQIQPTETVLLPSNLPTRLCESETTDGLTVLLFCDVHIDIGATLNLL